MMKGSRDKMQREDEVKDNLPGFENFHFAGDGERPPMTIRARTQEDANRQYKNVFNEPLEAN